MKSANKAKNKYNEIIIPKELSKMVNKTIKENRPKRMSKLKNIAIASSMTVVIFAGALNTSTSFAEYANNIPIVSNIAKVLTFKNYTFNSGELNGSVKTASVELTDKELENKINESIKTRVNEAIDEAKKNEAEYKEAYIETGGTEEDYKAKNISIEINYEVFSKSNDFLSFRVYSQGTFGVVYPQNYYYNIDTRTDKEVTLKSLFGDNYVKQITKVVKEQIAKQKSEGILFFDNVDSDDFKIREDIDFYINESGNAVIVFNKYEIASGADGRLEYEIKTGSLE